jgi:hypothetical protein
MVLVRLAVLCCADAWSVHSCSCKCAGLFDACVHNHLVEQPRVTRLQNLQFVDFVG